MSQTKLVTAAISNGAIVLVNSGLNKHGKFSGKISLDTREGTLFHSDGTLGVGLYEIYRSYLVPLVGDAFHFRLIAERATTRL